MVTQCTPCRYTADWRWRDESSTFDKLLVSISLFNTSGQLSIRWRNQKQKASNKLCVKSIRHEMIKLLITDDQISWIVFKKWSIFNVCIVLFETYSVNHRLLFTDPHPQIVYRTLITTTNHSLLFIVIFVLSIWTQDYCINCNSYFVLRYQSAVSYSDMYLFDFRWSRKRVFMEIFSKLFLVETEKRCNANENKATLFD